MVESLSNFFGDSVDYFDGPSKLESLLNPVAPTIKRFQFVENVKFKPIDETDLKLISYLQGKKVYFSEEELNRYIIG